MANVTVRLDRLNEVFDSDSRSDSMIAESFGISKQTISAWRNGTRSPKKNKLKEIADFYHKDIMWFFGFDDQAEEKPISQVEDERIKEIISLLSRASDQKIDAALQIVRLVLNSEEGE